MLWIFGPMEGCVFKSKACPPYLWLTPKELYILLLAFDLISPFRLSETYFIFMDLLKANFQLLIM